MSQVNAQAKLEDGVNTTHTHTWSSLEHMYIIYRDASKKRCDDEERRWVTRTLHMLQSTILEDGVRCIHSLGPDN
jgi:hypothetical protein